MSWWGELIQQNYDWFWDISIVLGITVVVSLLWRLARKRLVQVFANTKNDWDDVVIAAIGMPITWMIIVVGFTWAGDITSTYFERDIGESISAVRQLSLLIMAAWALWRLINRVEENQLISGMDPTTVQLVGKLAKLSVTILIILPLFQLLGISISGILAFGGMGGLIVGLAAKDLLANFFGSMIIYMDKPKTR